MNRLLDRSLDFIKLLPEVPKPRKKNRAAARRETQLHAVADSHAPRVEVAVRLAFALGRKAIGRSRDADRAVKAIRKSLEDTLPKVLRKVYIAGGEMSAGMLRSAAFNPEQERDERGRWTDDTSDPLAGEKPGEHTPEGQRKLIDYLEKATGEKFKSHGSVGRGETSKNDFDIIMRASTQEELERMSDEANQYQSDLMNRVKRGEISERVMMEELFGESEHPVDKALKRIGFESENYVEFDISSSGTSGEPEVAVQRYRNKTGHSVEVWIPLRTAMRHATEFRTAKRGAKRIGPLAFTFDAASEEAIAWADRHAAKLIDGISETSREAINNAIAEALEEGTDPYEAILEAVGSEDRAHVIAHHEVMMAVHEGQREAWRQATEEGLLTGTERPTWIVTGDDKVCPICTELEGKTRELDGQYETEDGEFDGPPAHPRCRCTEGLT